MGEIPEDVRERAAKLFEQIEAARDEYDGRLYDYEVVPIIARAIRSAELASSQTSPRSKVTMAKTDECDRIATVFWRGGKEEFICRSADINDLGILTISGLTGFENVAAYAPSEWLAFRVRKFGQGAPEEIEVTDEMANAGIDAVYPLEADFYEGTSGERLAELVTSVYRAMAKAKVTAVLAPLQQGEAVKL